MLKKRNLWIGLSSLALVTTLAIVAFTGQPTVEEILTQTIENMETISTLSLSFLVSDLLKKSEILFVKAIESPG